MTQNERIIDYLRRHGSITGFDALRYCGVMRLPARIKELETDGNVFTRKYIEVPTAHGKSRVIRYTLIREAKHGREENGH